MNVHFVSLLISLFIFQVNSSESFECFSCDYHNYLLCHEKIPCKSDNRQQATCYKFIVKDLNGNEKFRKGCQKYVNDPMENLEFLQEEARLQQQSVVDYLTCNYDRCNSADKLTNTVLFMAIVNVFCLFFL